MTVGYNDYNRMMMRKGHGQRGIAQWCKLYYEKSGGQK